MKSYVQTDYLGDIKASEKLIDMIKAYYISQGISTFGMKFEVIREVDQYGSRYYAIRSNLRPKFKVG